MSSSSSTSPPPGAERASATRWTAARPRLADGGVEPPTWSWDDCSLRPLREGDAAAWLEYLADPAVRRHTSIPNLDLASVGAQVRRLIAEYASATSCRWALAGADDRLVGTCGFSNWSLDHGHAELVYDLAPAYWGRGWMRRAVGTVLGWAFEESGFHRVHALVMDTNERSIGLLERGGFTREGLLREYRMAAGIPRDFFMYSLLRNERR